MASRPLEPKIGLGEEVLLGVVSGCGVLVFFCFLGDLVVAPGGAGI